MNQQFNIWMMFAFLGGVLLFTSCEDDEITPDPGPVLGYVLTDKTVDGTNYREIAGNINEDFTMDAATNWLLSGGVFVTEGSHLTIEEGTTISSDPEDGTTDFLVISQGCQIHAHGSASQPIVMTSLVEEPGKWGGLIINGYAVINTGDTAEGECNSGTYGGNNDADNSGTLKYIRVEYAGLICGTDDELNGFTFNGVGSGTTLEYLQAYRGKDDGIEFFGGKASLKYAVSTGNHDDSFDWTHGWRGNGQYWVVEQLSDGGDRGFEADNNGDDNAAEPFSNPTISNVTLVGNDDGDEENTGIRLREGTKGKIYNAIVVNFPSSGVRVSDDQTATNVANGDLVFDNSIVHNNGTNFKDADAFEADTDNSTLNPLLNNGYIGSVNEGAMDPSTLGSWFTASDYKGAVMTGNDWTAGWTRR